MLTGAELLGNTASVNFCKKMVRIDYFCPEIHEKCKFFSQVTPLNDYNKFLCEHAEFDWIAQGDSYFHCNNQQAWEEAE
jgi:hypothetical protein